MRQTLAPRHRRSSSESTISITNSPLGIHVPAGSIVSPFGVGTFVIENNGVGLDFAFDGTAIIRGGLMVRNNGTGCGRRTAPGSFGSSPSHRTRPPSPGMASMWIFVSEPALRSMALTLALLRVIRRS
jgi:hypothetical protein